MSRVVLKVASMKSFLATMVGGFMMNPVFLFIKSYRLLISCQNFENIKSVIIFFFFLGGGGLDEKKVAAPVS